MTGTIKCLDSASASGVITAADGVIVGFRRSAVLAYDVPILAVGQVVSFDLEGGRRPLALNVCVQRAPQSLNGQERRQEITRLRYMGFQQEGGIRSYRFELFVPGEARATFTVNTDLALFTKHHVGIQEGPGLCLHLLAAELDLAGAAAGTPFQYSLTDREMLAYLATRPVPRAKPGPKRGLPAPGAASHVA
jgi:cold shock CspA family protein